MNSLQLYLVNASICITLFYLFYVVFLKKETFHKLNRYYLIAGGLFSVIAPVLLEYAISLNFSPEKVNSKLAVYLQPVFVSNSTFKNSITLSEIVNYLYITVAIAMAIMFVYRILFIALLALKRNSGKINGYTKIVVNSKHAPFSFFKLIFLPEDEKEVNYESIIEHESAHIKQNHSLDILFFELLKIVMWFNPIVWLYKKEVQAQHEFLADIEVINKGKEINAYRDEIFQFYFNLSGNAITNNFNSLLKRRIIMLNSKKSTAKSKLKLLLSVPMIVVLLLLMTVANEGKVLSSFNSGKVLSSFNSVKDSVYSEVDTYPEYPGGQKAMIEFISKNLYYPELSVKAGIQGKVVVSFVIDKTGKVKDVKVLEGIGGGCDESAIDIIKKMPSWIPGKHKGEKVAVQMAMPIMFKLN